MKRLQRLRLRQRNAVERTYLLFRDEKLRRYFKRFRYDAQKATYFPPLLPAYFEQ